MTPIATAKSASLPCPPQETNPVLLNNRIDGNNGNDGHPAILPLDEAWAAFVQSDPQSNIFHHPLWINLLAECYGYRPFLVADCDRLGGIRAGLPFMEIRSPFTGRRWVSLPFTDHCRPLSKDSASLDRLASTLAALFRDRVLDRIELRGDLTGIPSIKTLSHYVIHTLELDSDVERVARHFDRTHRQNIRSAERNQLQIAWGKGLEDMRRFYALQADTRRRQGVPVQPWRYFKLLEHSVIENGLGSVLLASKDGQDLAGLLLLHWHNTLICKYAASREESRILRPNNLLFWFAIRWACESGFRVFDMGRTDLENEGLRRFKKGWGAQEIPLTYFAFIKSSASSEAPRSVPTPFRTIIRKSPVWMCRLLGELLYRHVG